MKYFKNAISSWEVWEKDVLTPVKEFYGDKLPEFLDDTKAFYTQKQIYILFNMNYRNMVVRNHSREDFLEQLKLTYIDNIPKLYVATLAFVNDEFQKLLKEENRGDKRVDSGDTLSKTKTKQGVPPSNLTVSDDLSQLNIKNAEYLENALQDAHTSQDYNVLQALKQIINSNVNGVILDWLKKFSNLFSVLVRDEFEWTIALSDVLYGLVEEIKELKKQLDVNDSDDKSLLAKVVALQTQVTGLITTIETNKTLAHTELMDEVNKLTTNITNIEKTLQAKDVELQTNINNAKTELQNLVNTTKTELQNNINAVDAKFANYALKTGGNEFVGIQKFYVSSTTQPYPTVVLDSVVGASNYIGFNRNGRSKAYVGMGSKDNENLYIGTRDNKDLKFEVTGNISFNNKKLSNVGAPTDNTDAVNKQYLDQRLQSVAGFNPDEINGKLNKVDSWVTLGDDTTIKKNTIVQDSVSLKVNKVPSEDLDVVNKLALDNKTKLIGLSYSMGVYYVDAVITKITKTEVMANKLFIIEYDTNLEHVKTMNDLICIGVCLKGYSENNMFCPIETFRYSNGKYLKFVLHTQKEKADLKNMNVRFFLAGTRQMFS